MSGPSSLTSFALLCDLAGLSQREAADFLGCSESHVDKARRGVRSTPEGQLNELRGLIAEQELGAREVLAHIATLNGVDAIDLAYPVDDDEARGALFGWPCVGAWRAFAARVIATEPRVQLVCRSDDEIVC